MEIHPRITLIFSQVHLLGLIDLQPTDRWLLIRDGEVHNVVVVIDGPFSSRKRLRRKWGWPPRHWDVILQGGWR